VTIPSEKIKTVAVCGRENIKSNTVTSGKIVKIIKIIQEVNM
jgi:hypothetical protein